LVLMAEEVSIPWKYPWVVATSVGIFVMTYLLCTPRRYVREEELKRMSLMEVISIFSPIPLVVGWLWAIPLMMWGLGYFYLLNKALWGVVTHPRV